MLFISSVFELYALRYTSIHCTRRPYVSYDESMKVLSIDIYLMYLTRICQCAVVISPLIFFFTTNVIVSSMRLQNRTILYSIYITIVIVINIMINGSIADVAKHDRLHIHRSKKILDILTNSLTNTNRTTTSHTNNTSRIKSHNDDDNDYGDDCQEERKSNDIDTLTSAMPRVKTYRITSGSSTLGDGIRAKVSSYLEMYSLYDDDKTHVDKIQV